MIFMGTLKKGILFKSNRSATLKAYIDADYVGSVDDRMSIT